MDEKIALGEPESSWSENTTPASDDIEEVIRQVPPVPPRLSFSTRPRLMRPPIRRRLRVEEHRGGKTYQTFEISTMESRRSIDGSESSASAITVVTSATSSCTDPWSSSGYVEEEDDSINWNQDEDMLLVPKIEPVEDDLDMTDVADLKDDAGVETPSVMSTVSTPAVTKRPRGRPRKHPKISPESMAKITKGRSKTGCITCRRRKKKCDETKPGCMNCEKNSVKCEGYPEKTMWKSGKEKAEEAARLRRVSLPNIKLPPVINGVETTGDQMFFHHYIYRLSSIFTVEAEQNNAFKSMLLPMAAQHAGLMHSILALSSKHIDYRSPYGIQFLKEHPDVDVETLEQRSQYHQDRAFEALNSDLTRKVEGDKCSVTIPAIYGQMLCNVLQTLSNDNPRGEHRVHLQAYKSLIQQYVPEDGDYLKFIHEFFQYHICADELICLPPSDASFDGSDDWNLPSTVLQPAAVRLLGVSDGLFLYMSKITNIRNKIRQNMELGIDPVVDYTSLYRAAEIDAGIREWAPAWPQGDSRDLSAMLYKQMMWVYLWRTIYPPKATTWRPDPRIKEAVNDAITLLNLFGPRDPSQTLVLAPAFVIGCAAFEPEQREPIREAIAVVKSYMEYKNSDTALQVLEEVWRLMDAKDERSWDWQSIAHDMGIDFLAT